LRKLHNEELQTHVLFTNYNYNYQAKDDAIGKVFRAHGERMTMYRILVGKPEGKRPLGRPSHTWVYNIKMDLKETGVVWTGLMWLRIGKGGELL
jgi:hypothetical protein